MPFTLRTRLLASYLLLLALTLGVIVITLLLLLSSRPEPNSIIYQRLIYAAQGLSVRALVDDFNQRRLAAPPNGLEVEPQSAAMDSSVRWLILVGSSVIGDSAGYFSQGDQLTLIYDLDYVPPYPERQIVLRSGARFGEFTDTDGTRWLYVATEHNLRYNLQSVRATILLADVPSTRSLQGVLAELGMALFTPLLQSAVLGLVVAVILASLISRTIAGPLQAFAHAAADIARGHYDHQLPVAGPPEVREVAEALNSMSAEVRDTQIAQRDFMANVSHDLKTPLTSIQGYSQAIMDGTAKDPARAAAIIHDEAARLTRMVAELTDLARLQAGGITMRRDTVDVAQTVRSIVERLSIMASQRGVTIYTDLYEGLYITGDGDRLAQVLTNLLSNAIKFTRDGVPGKVWVRTSLNQNGVEISVRDNGIGIPADELPRIFERFYQVDKARGPQRGAGLGLAISHEIIQAHGGQIFVESLGLGQGATFTVWLPLLSQTAAPPVLAEHTHNGR